MEQDDPPGCVSWLVQCGRQMHGVFAKARKAGLHALVLAAGASRRYGSPKQLARYRGESLVARSSRLAQAAGAEEVHVVLGYRAALIGRALQGGSAGRGEIAIIRNPRWREGMGRSLACGVRKLHPGTKAVLVCLSDQPMLEIGDLKKLVWGWQENPRAVVASLYAGKLGVPALFPRSWFRALRSLSADRGAQGLLASSGDVVSVPMPRAAIDIDYPQDLFKLAT